MNVRIALNNVSFEMLHQILVVSGSIELFLAVLINWCLILQVQNLHYKHINLNKTASTSKSNVNSIFKNVKEEYAAIISALGLIITTKYLGRLVFIPSTRWPCSTLNFAVSVNFTVIVSATIGACCGTTCRCVATVAWVGLDPFRVRSVSANVWRRFVFDRCWRRPDVRITSRFFVAGWAREVTTDIYLTLQVVTVVNLKALKHASNVLHILKFLPQRLANLEMEKRLIAYKLTNMIAVFTWFHFNFKD